MCFVIQSVAYNPEKYTVFIRLTKRLIMFGDLVKYPGRRRREKEDDAEKRGEMETEGIEAYTCSTKN